MGVEAAAAAIMVAAALAILFHKLKQPTVTAYILTGLLLGPAVFGITSHSQTIKIFSEIGLAFLLFLIGIEMDISEIGEIINSTMFIGGLQMAFMFCSGLLIGNLLGFTFTKAIFAGIFLMFSSTAVVVKMLADKDQINTLPGRLNVSILLLQDIVVVLGLAVLNTGISTPTKFALGITETLGFIALTALISYISSKYVLKHLFSNYAEEKHGFLIYAVAWLFLFIEISQLLGISIEIGAFLAGIGMGRLKISGEVMERIRPLTDVFMAVFFIGVGLKLEPSAITTYWDEALIFSMLVIPLKFISEFSLTDISKFSPETSFISSINMTQISEFSIILATLAATKGYISTDFVGFAALTAITTMSISSYFITFNKKIYSKTQPILKHFESEAKKDVSVKKLKNHAVIIGYDNMTKNILPTIEEFFSDVVVIDSDADNVKELSQSSYEYIYGDFKHGEIRNSANLNHAELVISASGQHDVNLQIMEDIEDATVFLRADSPDEALELYELGTHYVIRKNMLASEQLTKYLETYFEDKEKFKQKVETEMEKIRWINKWQN
jgi:Kef-type K+ transport system membrane component KefB